MSPKNRGSGTALLILLLAAGLAVAGVSASGPVLRPARPVPHFHWSPTDFVATPCYNDNCPDEAAWAPSAPLGDPDGNWVSVPPPTTEPNRMCSANCYDEANDLLYMIGGDPAGYYGVANCQRFNPVTNTWTNLASMPGARTWLDGEGAFVQHLGKIFICGGYTGSANNQTYIYTVATNTWTTGASMSSATLAYQSGIWRDSLIYIMGGTGPSLTGSAVVQVYNPVSNTWATATSLPEAGDMGSGTIIGDTIYITNSYNRSSGTLWTNARKGYINPSNPLTITWSTWTGVPTYGFNGGTTRLGGKVYRMGGFASLSGGPHKRGWVYSPSTGAVDTLPWLPSPPNTGVARCNFLNRREAGNELFKFAGDDEGDWSTPNNTYYRNQFTPPHDVGVKEILEPAGGRLTPGTPVVPTIIVGNFGLNAETDVPVYFVVDSIEGTNVYSEVTLVSLGVGEEETLYFPDWTPNCELWSGYKIQAFTALVGDAIPTNDTLKMVGLYTQDEIYTTPGGS
ncbi:MAG: kelch repeat-containing protein, partial [candidate division WOR-3 bacterium]